MSSALLGFLVLLLHLCSCEWSSPILLHDEADYGFSPEIFSNSIKLNSYILLSVLPRNKSQSEHSTLGFRVHSTLNNNLDSFTVIDSDYDSTFGSLRSSYDLSNMYSIATGTRKKHYSGTECDNADDAGCNEIWFRESSNNGKSWSIPEPIQRNNLSDRAHRQGGALLTLKDSSRIFIFFSKSEVLGKSSIAFTSRPPGSKIFSREIIISELKNAFLDFAVIATQNLYQKKSLLHVAWIEGNGNLMYSTSSNLGLKWSPPKNLFKVISISQNLAPAQFITSPKKPEELCLSYVDEKHNVQLLCVEGDFINKDNNNPILIASGISYVRSEMCQNLNNIMVFVTRTTDETLRCFLYDYDNKQVIEIESPFKGQYLLEFPQVACDLITEDKNVINVKVVAFDRRNKKSLLTLGKFPLK